MTQANPDLHVEIGRHWLHHMEQAAGWLVVCAFAVLRHLNLKRSSNVAAWLMRRVGPGLLRGHSTASAQLAIAYPDKSPAELEQILAGMWDNLARLTVEYVHLDRIWDFELDNPQRQGNIVLDDATIERCKQLRARRGPALMFGAHLGNWEVSALAAKMFTPDVDVIFKAPRITAIADKLVELRSSSGAGLLSADASAVPRIRDALKQGRMIGMLVDEYYADGVPVTMFNRTFPINPLFARFVRIFDCPFHGFFAARMPDGRIRLTVTEAIEPVRDARGRVDVNGTMQTIASTNRRLGPRSSRAVALDAPALALSMIRKSGHRFPKNYARKALAQQRTRQGAPCGLRDHARALAHQAEEYAPRLPRLFAAGAAHVVDHGLRGERALCVIELGEARREQARSRHRARQSPDRPGPAGDKAPHRLHRTMHRHSRAPVRRRAQCVGRICCRSHGAFAPRAAPAGQRRPDGSRCGW